VLTTTMRKVRWTLEGGFMPLGYASFGPELPGAAMRSPPDIHGSNLGSADAQ